MTSLTIKTPSDLKYAVLHAGHLPHFFSRDTMRFFGDTMANYALRQPRLVQLSSGGETEAYELVRKRPVRNGLGSSTWFDRDFHRVFPA